jgi:diguanylate cyclase (GGDEF)-like protein
VEDIANITKQTILNLERKNIDATPREYTKEFCKIAKEISFTINDCQYFYDSLDKLTPEERKGKRIETIYDLVDVLLKRVDTKSLDKISDLLQKSLRPSIALKIGDDLQSFSIKIGDSPSLIFEESIQQEMEKFIEQRFEVDKKVVAKKTADIARLITLMSKYLSDAIDSNKKGSNNVSDIKDKIRSIDISNNSKAELDKLQTKLVNAAITIEQEISTVNKNLENGRDEVSKLEDRIKELEKELQETKKKNTKDYLTGTLTRRAYETELKKFDEKYKRLGLDFAIIFFDIDHFKKVNDNYGHDGGDVILKTFAKLLMKLTRDIDIVGRFGGEEFVVALHYKDERELEKYISRIKNVVTKNKFVYLQNKVHITFSAGVHLRSKNNNIEQTINNADNLLYEAKRSGRNKIIFWDGKEL